MISVLKYKHAKTGIIMLAIALTIFAFPLDAFLFKPNAAEITVNNFASLKNAVESASDGDVIYINDDLIFPQALLIDKSLIFRANKKTELRVSGNFRHIDVRAYNGGDIRLEFDDIELIGRKTSDNDTTPGGGIFISRTQDFETANKSNTIDTLYLVNAVIRNVYNSGPSHGGGISFTWPKGQAVIDYTNLDISGGKTLISDCSAGNRGGGIAANHVTINDGLITSNIGVQYAGGVYAYGGLTMNGGAISGNSVNLYGGGTANYHGDYIINGGSISDNFAGYGGGVFMTANLTMNGGKITDNKADNMGGGIYAANVEINGGEVTGNTAVKDGGGIASYAQARMTSGVLSGNTAGLNGGGMYCGGLKDTTLTGGLINGNTALNNGGGMYIQQGASVTGAAFSANTAGLDGGGIWIADLNRITVDGASFTDNNAQAGYIWDIDNPSNAEQAADAIIHKANITNTTYTKYFTNAYNNYDINYLAGTLLTSFKVIYDPNGATGGDVPASEEHMPRATVIVADNTGSLVKNDLIFKGWNTHPDGVNGTAYSVGQPLIMPLGDVVLYAQWGTIAAPGMNVAVARPEIPIYRGERSGVLIEEVPIPLAQAPVPLTQAPEENPLTGNIGITSAFWVVIILLLPTVAALISVKRHGSK